MPATTIARLSTTRSDNMEKRRQRILAEARILIANEGFDAFKVRKLADLAGVTVPTIYNLIGGKPEILNIIIHDMVARLQSVQRANPDLRIDQGFEFQIDALRQLFASDEAFYRAAFVAGDRSGLFAHGLTGGIFERSLENPVDVCHAAQNAGLLEGRVSAEQLGQQIYDCYRLARRDWVSRYIDLIAFRMQALTGIFLSLAADASPAFRVEIQNRLKKIELKR